MDRLEAAAPEPDRSVVYSAVRQWVRERLAALTEHERHLLIGELACEEMRATRSGGQVVAKAPSAGGIRRTVGQPGAAKSSAFFAPSRNRR